MSPETNAEEPAGEHVVIAGGGFGGIEVAKALGAAGIRATVVDRQNHHLFQPLLYQVATAALSPADIAEPIRRILRPYPSTDVLFAEVIGIDKQTRTVLLKGHAPIRFDRLVIATGSRPSYFGNDDWEKCAPGLKTIDDARRLRTRLLLAFERAEICDDPVEQHRLMTSVVIGAGPTGVEMAGSIAELARYTLARDFRKIKPNLARTILIEAGPRALPAFTPKMSKYTEKALHDLGVEIRMGQKVERISDGSVTVAGETIEAGTIVWAAGVKATDASGWLEVEPDRAGRIAVNPDLSVPGLDRIYVLGDLALLNGEDGQPLPGLAQVAKQQGQFLGKALAANIRSGTPLPPFQFHNRGNVAIIGRHAAVFEAGRLRLKGWPAWFAWAVVHVYLLVGFQHRVIVSLQWIWRYLTYDRGARLVAEDANEQK
ncbi:NAD(P)/FAD-dependent oxidoreductase [Flaviflagellibacter deserti]|uniref:NADH:ubiquinone reductase (non-electrogenic) n=1 Tax=Flaviflagellibacter deserti TaxID=2267266 RepID=A0ABV9Z1A2_9HYPH